MAEGKVVDAVERCLSCVRDAELTASHFHPDQQQLLFDRLNSLLSSLGNLQRTAQSCEAHLPLAAVRLVDAGVNPNQFSRRLLQCCVARNAVTKGKVDAVKLFRNRLLGELEAVFPAEVAAYRDMRMAALKEAAQAEEQREQQLPAAGQPAGPGGRDPAAAGVKAEAEAEAAAGQVEGGGGAEVARQGEAQRGAPGEVKQEAAAAAGRQAGGAAGEEDGGKRRAEDEGQRDSASAVKKVKVKVKAHGQV